MVKQLSFAQSLNIETIPVDSSAIKSIGYSHFTELLIIHFHPSRDGIEYLYTYSKVPQTIVEEFLRSKSKGKFYNDNIKNHWFDCTRITLT